MLIASPYHEINRPDLLPSRFLLGDHLGGFDKNRSNLLLDVLQSHATNKKTYFFIDYVQILENDIKEKYNRLNLKFDFSVQHDLIWKPFYDYTTHPTLNFKKFLCSFNGSPHVSRKLLTSALDAFGWFDSDVCSKNFIYDVDILDGHLSDYLDHYAHRMYRKFFIKNNGHNFFERIYSFGHVRYDHKNNVYNLQDKITTSFLHIVSESMATSYHPFVTEKFLYSVVTRGLFLSYAQPRWHDHLERYYGFHKYDKIFDYRFDSIANPIERLVELMCMISKFAGLSANDWTDLYEMESDTIEFNHDWYFSGDYLKHLEKFSS